MPMSLLSRRFTYCVLRRGCTKAPTLTFSFRHTNKRDILTPLSLLHSLKRCMSSHNENISSSVDAKAHVKTIPSEDITWSGCSGDYQVMKQIGKGRYSEVFTGINAKYGGSLCAIKILKPVKVLKIEREIKILKHLQGGVNIVRLLDNVRDANTGATWLVLEHACNNDFKVISPTFSLLNIKQYCFELLKALSFSHSRGIMHRDVKPLNIATDFVSTGLPQEPPHIRINLLDWGLAEFYQPGQEYSCRVSTRHFKAPELLVDYRTYDYSVDMWSFGCILAGLMFRMDSFFQGKDNVDQLGKIIFVLGSESFNQYLQKHNIVLSGSVYDIARIKRKKKKWERYINDSNRHLFDIEGLDLLDKTLRFDHGERISANDALKHPFFYDLSGK